AVVAALADVDRGEAAFLRAVLREEGDEDEKHRDAAGGHPEGGAKPEVLREDGDEREAEDQPSANQDAEDAGERAALAEVEPVRVDLHDGERAERLEVAVDTPERDERR